MIKFYIVVLACTLLVLSSVVYYFFRKRQQSKQYAVHPLLSYGQKIVVDFDECELKTNTYYEEVERESFPTRTAMIDALCRPNQSSESVKRDVSVLIYKHQKKDGAIITYRTNPIYMQPELIRYNMLQQKKAVIYLDPANDANYFFDTGFSK